MPCGSLLGGTKIIRCRLHLNQFPFDEIDTRTYLVINFEVTNDSPTALDLFHRVGIIESKDEGPVFAWTALAGITDRKAEINESDYLARSEYSTSLVLKPGETRMIQAAGSVEGILSGAIEVGLFDLDEKPQAAIAVRVGPNFPPDKAPNIAERYKPQQSELISLPAVTSSLKGINHVFYPFEYGENGQEKTYLLVDQTSGIVYHGRLTDGQLIPADLMREQ